MFEKNALQHYSFVQILALIFYKWMYNIYYINHKVTKENTSFVLVVKGEVKMKILLKKSEPYSLKVIYTQESRDKNTNIFPGNIIKFWLTNSWKYKI